MPLTLPKRTLRAVFTAACLGALATSSDKHIEESVAHTISGRIDEENQSQMQLSLRAASLYGANTDHLITIDSIGGIARLGFEIVEDIENLAGDVTVKCVGRAASIAAIIFIAPDNVHRDATNECRIMIHRSRHDLKKYLNLENEQSMIVTREELEPHYLSLMADSTLTDAQVRLRQTVDDAENQSHTLTLSRAEIIAFYDAQMEFNSMMIQEISENSALSVSDVTYLFTQGDVEFSVSEAAFAGFLETINNQAIPNEIWSQGQTTLCSRYPILSPCTGPS